MTSIPRIRPIFANPTNSSICRNHRRAFTSTSHRRAADHNKGDMSSISSRLTKGIGQKSVGSHMRNMKREMIPNDLGLLPRTFIKPEHHNLPSAFSYPSKRLRIAWSAFRQKVGDMLGVLYYSKWAVKKHPITNKKQRSPARLRERYIVARDLHQKLNKAIAASDLRVLSKIGCQGLVQQMNIRSEHRRASGAASNQMTWRASYRGLTPPASAPWLIHALCPFKSTRIIADRLAQLPFGNDAKLRQVIVKICSRQTLDKGDGKGEITKDLDEYLVFQKMSIEGQEDDWMVWGTTKPMTMEQVDEFLADTSDSTSAWDQYKQKMGELMNTGSRTL